jgi:Tol biopolymer transport system component
MTGGIYQVQIGGPLPPFLLTNEYLPAPDRRATIYREGKKVYLGYAGMPILLWDQLAPYDRLAEQVFWSPDSRRVAYIWGGTDQHLVIADADGRNRRPFIKFDGETTFGGWSPDGEHILIAGHESTDIAIWSVSSGQQTHAVQGGLRLDGVRSDRAWSPRGDWLAYVWRASSGDTRLILVKPDGSSERSFDLGYILDSIARDDLVWSPDGRYVALRYAMHDNVDEQYRVGVYGTDGSALAGGDPPYAPNADVIPPLIWSPDSRVLSFVVRRPVLDFKTDQYKQVYTLMAYGPGERKLTTLADNLDRPPFYSPLRARVAVYSIAQARKTITIMGLDGSSPVKLVDNVDDAGNPDWSPDGKWVAAVWANGKVPNRRLRLTWMRPDGTEPHELANDFQDVHDLRWMGGGDVIAYIAWWRDGRSSVELVQTATGQRQVLADNFATIASMDYDPNTDTITYWWRAIGGATGQDVYRGDGSQVYRLRDDGDLQRPRRLFWSALGEVNERSVAAVKRTPFGALRNELRLAYADGRASVVLPGPGEGLGDPLWSPDGELLAYTWADRASRADAFPSWGPVHLEIVSAAGKVLWDFTPFPVYARLEWVNCRI